MRLRGVAFAPPSGAPMALQISFADAALAALAAALVAASVAAAMVAAVVAARSGGGGVGAELGLACCCCCCSGSAHAKQVTFGADFSGLGSGLLRSGLRGGVVATCDGRSASSDVMAVAVRPLSLTKNLRK